MNQDIKISQIGRSDQNFISILKALIVLGNMFNEEKKDRIYYLDKRHVTNS